MTVCVYAIRNLVDDKRYIGKTRDSKTRFASHRMLMQRPKPSNGVNRHLWNAARKHGINSFVFEIIETFQVIDEIYIGQRELHWMDHFQTCDRKFGYNLRRDTSTGMVMHPETIRMKSLTSLGDRNPNYGKKWTHEQKQNMSLNARFRHTLGIYDDDWKRKIGTSSSDMWKDEEKKRAMAARVSANRRKFSFLQLTRCGFPLRLWKSVKDILSANPDWKWQNIYSVCNGHKKTYMGHIWQKVPRYD